MSRNTVTGRVGSKAPAIHECQRLPIRSRRGKFNQDVRVKLSRYDYYVCLIEDSSRISYLPTHPTHLIWHYEALSVYLQPSRHPSPHEPHSDSMGNWSWLRCRKPVAAPIVGGMVTSTIYVLILVPIFFAFMKERAPRRRTMHRQISEDIWDLRRIKQSKH
jgi:hypothetical protein